MKRLLSIFTISALIASPVFSQETKLKKLEKLEKTEKSEKAVVIDSTAVKDTVAVELGDEVFSVKEIGDETKIKFGNKEIRIVEDEEGVVVYKNYGSDGDSYSWKRKDQDRFRGHLGGLDIGFNGFLTDFFETSLDPEDSYFDLNTAKSYNWSIVCPGVNLGFTRHFGISTGLGITFSKYRFDGNNTIIKGDDGVVGPYYPEDGIVYSKSKLYTTYATLPVILEVQIPVSGRNTINLGAGVVGAIKLGSKTKVVYNDDGKEKHKNKDDFSLNLLRWGSTVRAGYEGFQVYGTCFFTELFEAGKGPVLYPYEVGISFTINN